MQSTIEYGTTVKTQESKYLAEDYSRILFKNNLNYKPIEYYLQVGETQRVQGWILHLSAVLSQVSSMLEEVVPFLADLKIPFKIIMSEPAAEDLLHGVLGPAQIGKIVTIYSRSDSEALALAKQLIQLTSSYKGPAIPTDIRLGNVLYTRYGSFNPIIKLNPHGIEEKYIYDLDGQLIVDSYAIPFQLPENVQWPFNDLAAPRSVNHSKLQNGIYKILELLKPDPRGSVYKGLFLKNLLQVKNCVIKQGFECSGSDRFGRDMTDRLKWQYDLYQALADTIPMPVVYDLIKDEGFTLLVMQYVNGSSIYQEAQDLNPFCKSTHHFYPELRLLITYGIEIAKILHKLHKRGYVHRDVVPVNFLIDKKKRLFLIDMELAYCISSNTPDPPFTLGTSGFMAPEQEFQQKPSYEQDVYGLGATLLSLVTGLTPIKFNTKNVSLLQENLAFFIPSKELSSTIAGALNHNPDERPKINAIIESLQNFKMAATVQINAKHDHLAPQLDISKLSYTIAASLKGLTQPPFLGSNDLWCSKRLTVENYFAPRNKQYKHSPGLTEGVSGTLYVLARIHNAGVNIDQCETICKKAWKYLEEEYLHSPTKLSYGLHKGYAGLAIALAENIRANALTNPKLYEDLVYEWLTSHIDKYDIAHGIAGQGIALLRCEPLLKPDAIHNLLNKIVKRLLSAQQLGGNWVKVVNGENNSSKLILDLDYDDTGILYFLLEYFAKYKDEKVYNAICKGLQGIVKNKKNVRHLHNLAGTRESYEYGDGGKGMIVLFLKAYEILNDKTYKDIVETALSKYPRYVINTNFTQYNGLAALGELYLEAWRILKSEEWKIRTDWITNVFLHSFIENQDDQSGFWQMEENNPPTADLFTGVAGILHFLGRCLYPSKIGYRLLN